MLQRIYNIIFHDARQNIDLTATLPNSYLYMLTEKKNQFCTVNRSVTKKFIHHMSLKGSPKSFYNDLNSIVVRIMIDTKQLSAKHHGVKTAAPERIDADLN